MSEFKGSETEKNLLKAFDGESKARTRYNMYARIAKSEGMEDAAKIFETFSDNEKEHALVWLKWLCNNSFAKTEDNIKTAIASEHFENSNMYPSFAAKAKEEGFESLSELFNLIAQIEKSHEEKLQQLLEMMQSKDAKPDKYGNYKWKCSVCGCIIEQKEKPSICPFCSEKDVFFYKVQ